MSLCDECVNPGRCCVGINLNGGHFLWDCVTPLEVLVKLAGACAYAPDLGEDTVEVGLPFMPLWRNSKGDWLLWCPSLRRDGRCGDYEHRPFPCRQYPPGRDRLCAMYEEPRDAA